MNTWSSLTDVQKEFPKEEYDWYEISDPEEASFVVANLAFHGKDVVFAESRWFSPVEGVVLVKKNQTNHTSSDESQPIRIVKPKKRNRFFVFIICIIIFLLMVLLILGFLGIDKLSYNNYLF